MAISSFHRPQRRSSFSLLNVKTIILTAIVGTIIYLMLAPLPQAEFKDYHVTKIEIQTQDIMA